MFYFLIYFNNFNNLNYIYNNFNNFIYNNSIYNNFILNILIQTIEKFK
jgi:hypothetical protein